MNKSATRFVIRIRGVSLDCSTCSDKRCSKWGQVKGKKEEECKTRDEIIGHSFVLESNRICQKGGERGRVAAVMACLDGLTIIIVVMSGSGYGSTREGGTVQWSNEIGLEVG